MLLALIAAALDDVDVAVPVSVRLYTAISAPLLLLLPPPMLAPPPPPIGPW